MKSFFEEYGFVMLSAIVVLLLIAMATPISENVKTNMLDVVSKFATQFNNELPTGGGGE